MSQTAATRSGMSEEFAGAHAAYERSLADGTRVLAARDVPRGRAATDLGNVPMANAFQHTLTMTWT